MTTDTLSIVGGPTMILLFASLGLFVYSAITSRSVRTFQFQISLFVIIWIAGEIFGLFFFQRRTLFDSEDVATAVHVSSMAFIGIMMWIRYYLARRKGLELIDETYR